jgi:hypothetical protein
MQEMLEELREWLDARSKRLGFVCDQISDSEPAEADPPRQESSKPAGIGDEQGLYSLDAIKLAHGNTEITGFLKYNCAWDSEGRTTCGHVAKLESRLSKAKRLLHRLLAKDLCHRKSLYLGGCRPDCPACAVQKFLENDDDKKER